MAPTLVWTATFACFVASAGYVQPQETSVDEWNRNWRYYASVRIRCQSYDFDAEIDADFTRILKEYRVPGTFDRRSIRICEAGLSDGSAPEVPFAFSPNPDFDPTFNARGKLQFRVTRGVSDRTFHVYFDLLENGEKPLVSYGAPQASGNWLSNGSFEDLDAKTSSLVDWPFERRNAVKAVTGAARTGTVSVQLLSPKSGQAASLGIPGNGAFRVVSGEKYRLSFWSRGEDTNDRPLLVTAYWYDLSRKNSGHELMAEEGRSHWDWSVFSGNLVAPPEAEWLRFYIATYTTSGGVWIDDVCLTPEKLPRLSDLTIIEHNLAPVIVVEPNE